MPRTLNLTKSRSLSATVALVATILGTAAPASADMILFGAFRSVSVGATVMDGGGGGSSDAGSASPADPFAPFAATLAALATTPAATATGTAGGSQTSDFAMTGADTASGLTALLGADASLFLASSNDSGGSGAASSVVTLFQLTAPHTFTLTGSVAADSGRALFSLTGGTSAFFFEALDAASSTPFTFSGILDPGDYLLQAAAEVAIRGAEGQDFSGPLSEAGRSSTSFSFLLGNGGSTPPPGNPVPEPSSVVLLGAALAAGAVRRRWRRRAEPVGHEQS